MASPRSPFIPTPLLLILLYISRTDTHVLDVSLEPQTHARTFNPPVTILNIHRNNTPSKYLVLTITPMHPSESLVSVTHTLSAPSTITFFPPTAQHLILTAILTFPVIGTTNFSISARTTSPFYVYKASFRAITAGVAVTHSGIQLTAENDDGFRLGSYKAFVDTPQLAVPILLQPPFESAPVDLHLRLATLSGAQPTADTFVDAVHSGTCTVSVPSNPQTPSNTIFLRDRSRFTTHVTFPPACGLAISEDFNWLLIRFNTYRVADYGFGVAIEWRGPINPPEVANFFPMQTFVRFVFDSEIPPVVVRSFTATIDPFGGELLEIPVENVLSPPQHSDMSTDDFLLRLQVTARRQEVTFLTPERVDRVSGGLLHVLRFRTKPLQASAQPVQYVLLGGIREKIPAVVHPGETIKVSLASDDLAILDACSQNETAYVDDFLLVEIGMRYNQSTFSEYKKGLMKRYIRSFFPWLPASGLRLVDLKTGKICFAVLLLDRVKNATLSAQADGLDDAIVNGSFALAVNVWDDDITSHGITVVQTTLCDAFPHLVLSGTLDLEIYGVQIPLLLVWVFVTTATSFISTFLMVRTVLRRKKRKSNEAFTTESYHLNSGDYESMVETEAHSTACSSYPSEARESFARRYQVHTTITPENVRDSDLDSTVVSEPEGGTAGIGNFAVNLGREIAKSLGQNWIRILGLGSQSESASPRTPSSGESPSILVEQVVHTSAADFAPS